MNISLFNMTPAIRDEYDSDSVNGSSYGTNRAQALRDALDVERDDDRWIIGVSRDGRWALMPIGAGPIFAAEVPRDPG